MEVSGSYLHKILMSFVTTIIIFIWYTLASFFSVPSCFYLVFNFIFPDWLLDASGKFLFPKTQFPGFCFILGRKRKIYLHGPTCDSPDECAIIISNHQTSVDCVTLSYFAYINNKLQDLRYLIKQSILSSFPVAGIGLAERGCVPLKRNNHVDGDSSRIKKSVNSMFRRTKKAWMVNFVEGTRRDYTKKNVILSSDKHWEKLGFPPTKYVLCPRVTGLEILKESFGKNLTHVYDVTVVYKDSKIKYSPKNPFYSPSMNEFFWNQNIEVHFIVKKYNIDEFNEKYNDLKSYLYKSFQEKDQIIEKCLLNNLDNSEDFKEIHMKMEPFINTAVSYSVILATFAYLGIRKILFSYFACSILGYMGFAINYT